VALALSALFTSPAVRVWQDAGDTAAKRMFGFSILYLFLLFRGHAARPRPRARGGLGLFGLGGS